MSPRTSSRWLAVIALAPLVACSSGDDDTAATQATTSGLPTSSSTSSGTTDDSDAGTASDSGTSTGTTTTTTATSSETTTAESTGVSSTSGTTEDTSCPPGSVGCPCDGDTCDGELVCASGTCEAPLDCADDDNEPNDNEADATDLGMITDDDDDKSSVSGVLSGKADVDFYRFIGTDTAFHTTEPTRTIDADQGLRFCKFLDCLEDGPALTEVDCPAGTDFALSPELRPGCCSSEGFGPVDYNCPGGDDSVLVFLRVDKPIFDECVSYTIEYFL